MDEPTASLSAHEARRLFRIVRSLRDRGVAILFISHRMEEVFEIADRVTVLRDGRWISTRPTGEATADTAIRDMVGRPLEQLFIADAAPNPAPVRRSRSATSDAKERSRASRSRSGPARSSGSPDSSGRDGPTSAWPCSGSLPRTRARSGLDDHAVTIRSPREALPPRHRLHAPRTATTSG